MKKTGYIICLLIGIPVFILLINFLFFRGNNPTEAQVNEYIKASIVDTVFIPNNTPYNKEQYIAGLSRRGKSSAFLHKYYFYDELYKKFFVLLIFDGFDKKSNDRW